MHTSGRNVKADLCHRRLIIEYFTGAISGGGDIHFAVACCKDRWHTTKENRKGKFRQVRMLSRTSAS